MRRGGNETLLKQVAGIRALQCVAVEARASRAAEELEAKTTIHADGERRRLEIEDRWTQSLSAPVIQTQMLPLLSAAFLKEDEAVRAAADDVEQAASELETRTGAWRAASMHRDNAARMAREAVKERLRHREEAAVQDASDRHAQRWGRR